MLEARSRGADLAAAAAPAPAERPSRASAAMIKSASENASVKNTVPSPGLIDSARRNYGERPEDQPDRRERQPGAGHARAIAAARAWFDGQLPRQMPGRVARLSGRHGAAFGEAPDTLQLRGD